MILQDEQKQLAVSILSDYGKYRGENLQRNKVLHEFEYESLRRGAGGEDLSTAQLQAAIAGFVVLSNLGK